MFGTAGHSVVYQGTASPGLSDASTGKHLFVSFLLFSGPTCCPNYCITFPVSTRGQTLSLQGDEGCTPTCVESPGLLFSFQIF